MDRKSTIKTLRYIIRNLSDEDLFSDTDFIPEFGEEITYPSRVEKYIMNKLEI